METYLEKHPTLALLILGEATYDELLQLPDITATDIDQAYKLLKGHNYRIGLCERCDRRVIGHRVQWATSTSSLDAFLCPTCERICQPTGGETV